MDLARLGFFEGEGEDWGVEVSEGGRERALRLVGEDFRVVVVMGGLVSNSGSAGVVERRGLRRRPAKPEPVNKKSWSLRWFLKLGGGGVPFASLEPSTGLSVGASDNSGFILAGGGFTFCWLW